MQAQFVSKSNDLEADDATMAIALHEFAVFGV
jgi:hypothetical protein